MPAYRIFDKRGQLATTVNAPNEKAAIRLVPAALRRADYHEPQDGWEPGRDYTLELSRHQRTTTKATTPRESAIPRTVSHAEVHNRTSKPGTCLWCGRQLRLNRSHPDRYGDYGDNAFCGLRCGHAFATVAAVHGFRLRDYDGTKED